MKVLLSLIILLASQLVIATQDNQYSENPSQAKSVFSKNQKFDREGVELYDTNIDLKGHKKFGLGFAVGGATGVIGLNGEINLDSSEAAVFGLGTGPSYGTFNLGWKHNYEAAYLSPYTKVGYSKWFSSSRGTSGSASDSEILKRSVSESDIKSNRVDADFAVGSFGIEYNQLEGELSGLNLFGEVLMMAEIHKTAFIPSGAIGIIYYY